MNNCVIGIDIGTSNFAATRITSCGAEYFHFDIHTAGIDMPAALSSILDIITLSDSLICIEDQLCRNTTCVRVQGMLEALAFSRGLAYERVSSRAKYSWIQQIPRYCTGRINKRTLASHVAQIINPIRSFIYRPSGMEEISGKPIKLDDVADSVFICIAFYAGIKNKINKTRGICKVNEEQSHKPENVLASLYEIMRHRLSETLNRASYKHE